MISGGTSIVIGGGGITINGKEVSSTSFPHSLPLFIGVICQMNFPPAGWNPLIPRAIHVGRTQRRVR